MARQQVSRQNLSFKVEVAIGVAGPPNVCPLEVWSTAGGRSRGAAGLSGAQAPF